MVTNCPGMHFYKVLQKQMSKSLSLTRFLVFQLQASRSVCCIVCACDTKRSRHSACGNEALAQSMWVQGLAIICTCHLIEVHAVFSLLMRG